MSIPSYGQFIGVEGPLEDAAWRDRQGANPSSEQTRHTAYRRLIEGWEAQDIRNELRGLPHTPGSGEQPGPGPVSPDLWIGATAFRLPQLQMRGDDIRPYLEQYKACGFNILRCFGMKKDNTDNPHTTEYEGWALDPKGRPINHYFSSDLPRFFDTLKAFGLRCEWNALVDTKYLLPDHNEQVDFVGRTLDVYRAYGWPFSLGNEVTNGDWQTINLGAFSKPAGVFSSHGSSGTDETPVKPMWDYATYGARRKEHSRDGRGAATYSPLAWEEDAHLQPAAFIATEGDKPESYGYDVRFAELIGRHASVGNGRGIRGGFFHFPEGINGYLMPANVEACARAFVKGIRGG